MFVMYQKLDGGLYTIPAHHLGLNAQDGVACTRIQVSDLVVECIAKALPTKPKAIEAIDGMDGYCSYAVLRNAECNTYQHRSSIANVDARNILKQMVTWAKQFPEGIWRCT